MPAYASGFIRFTPTADRDLPQTMQDFGRDYGSKVPATLAPFGGRFIAKCPKPKSIASEGETHMVTFIIEFPSAVKAQGWFESPAYQAIIPIREPLCEFHMTVVPGVDEMGDGEKKEPPAVTDPFGGGGQRHQAGFYGPKHGM